MREDRFGDLSVRVVGGTDREGGGDGPVVVLLHGFGAPGTDLVGLWRVMGVPSEYRFVFPAAPLSLDMPGMMGDARAWWLIDVEGMQRALMEGRERDMTGQVPDGIDEARAKVVSVLDAVEERLGVTGDQIVLGGFSQGGMLALDVALQTDRRLAGLVVMSGTLLSKDVWVPRMAARSGTPVLQSHGDRDPLLPFSIAEQLRDHLRGAGLDVTWVPHRGAHEIPQPVLTALESFLPKALEPRKA